MSAWYGVWFHCVLVRLQLEVKCDAYCWKADKILVPTVCGTFLDFLMNRTSMIDEKRQFYYLMDMVYSYPSKLTILKLTIFESDDIFLKILKVKFYKFSWIFSMISKTSNILSHKNILKCIILNLGVIFSKILGSGSSWHFQPTKYFLSKNSFLFLFAYFPRPKCSETHFAELKISIFNSIWVFLQIPLKLTIFETDESLTARLIVSFEG